MKIELPWSVIPEGCHTIFGSMEDQFRIHYEHEVVYSVRNGKELHFQLLQMRDPIPDKKYPLVVYITGSGWEKQERFDRLPQLVEIARCGYVVASMEYGSTDDGNRFPSQIEDAKACIAFLKDHCEQYQIDPDRVAIWGDSSGGHTALMAGLSGDSVYSASKVSDVSTMVKCIIDFYGPVQLEDMDIWPELFPSTQVFWQPGTPLWKLFGGTKEEEKDAIAEASPLRFIEKGKELPPVLIMHGDHDPLVHPSQSIMLYEKLKACGQSVEFYILRNAEHGFHFWTPEVVSIVKKFLLANP